jgi:signal transduction histidine kinase
MGAFRLDPDPPLGEAAALSAGPDGLTGAVLLHNARWFTRIRWLVVTVLTGFAAMAALMGAQRLECVGISPPGAWPVYLAVVLVLLNLASLGWLRRLSACAPDRGVAANIWFQIVSDLTVLTILVYRIGATETVISFAYLFHITLACIFFGRRDSLVVTTMSAALFLATAFLEAMAVLPRASILLSGGSGPPDVLHTVLFAAPTVFVWFVVWYLVSTLSDTVRRRDRELDGANKRIVRADEDINLQMLRVTHDLKAPFSGIESNIQILKHSHWDETPECVREIIGKIDARSMTLRARIGDILTLGSLRSSQPAERVVGPVNLRGLLDAVLQDVQGLALDKKVSVELAGTASVVSDTRQLKILFSNLISNAVVYSREGGTVEVGIEEESTRVIVRVADHGIGISDKALPRVFEDFYRAQEAASFNPNSTGLGLAIVRQVARNLRFAIEVDSEQGKGTTFRVLVPKNDG